MYVQQPQQAKQNRGCLEAWCARCRIPALLLLASVCCRVSTDTCCALFLCAAWRAVRGPANVSLCKKGLVANCQLVSLETERLLSIALMGTLSVATCISHSEMRLLTQFAAVFWVKLLRDTLLFGAAACCCMLCEMCC